MRLTSKVFENGGVIPPEYTCQGEGSSPPLSWEDVPEEAGSLVLIMDDPDDAVGVACHWLLYDIRPTAGGARTRKHRRAGDERLAPKGTAALSAGRTRCAPVPDSAFCYQVAIAQLANPGLADSKWSEP